MGGKQAKVDNTNKNVVNNLKILDHTPQLESLRYLILIPSILSAIHLLFATYTLQKKVLKRNVLGKQTIYKKSDHQFPLHHYTLIAYDITQRKRPLRKILWRR